MADAPSRDQNKFIVRMPDGMRDQLKRLAEANGRSMNAEIVARLERSLRPDLEPILTSDLMERLRHSNAQLVEMRIEDGVREIILMERSPDLPSEDDESGR